MQITVKAHFNKQTKDSKKEGLQFYLKGDDEKRPELSQMTRSVVLLSIDEVEGVELSAEFKKTSKDSKKTVLDFEVKGDSSAAQTFEFYKMAGADIELTIKESQMSLEEFHGEPHEGLKGKIEKDGTVTVDENQTTLPI